MITLWGVWDGNVHDWVAGEWNTDSEEVEERVRQLNAGSAMCYRIRPAQFVRVPPEVVAAAKRLTALMDVAESDEQLILSWIARAVGSES